MTNQFLSTLALRRAFPLARRHTPDAYMGDAIRVVDISMPRPRFPGSVPINSTLTS
jgi:hypothetical protein